MRPGCAARCWHGFGVVSADASRTKPAEKLRGNRAAFLDKQGMSGRQAQRAQHRHLSTREAAALLGVHERTVRRYIAAGLLGNRKLPGGHYRIPQEAIGAFWSGGGDGARQRPRRIRAAERPQAGSASPIPAERARRSHRGLPAGERPAVAYDLSPEVLAALRKEVAAGDG